MDAMQWLIRYLPGRVRVAAMVVAVITATPILMAMAPASAQSPSATTAQTAQTPLKAGEIRPGFQLRDLDGQYRDISEWDGKLIVLNFWATWCPPCLHEIPVFSRLHNEHAGDGVQFLGVALDNLRDVKRFIKQHDMSYPTLYGDKDAMILAKIYGNKYGALPYTVIIGRDGVVLATHSGELHRDQVQALIKSAP